jgi:hypothetical protein
VVPEEHLIGEKNQKIVAFHELNFCGINDDGSSSMMVDHHQ